MKKFRVSQKYVYCFVLLPTCIFFSFAVLAMAQEKEKNEAWQTERAIAELASGLADSGVKINNIMLHQGTPLPEKVTTVAELMQLGEQIAAQITQTGNEAENVIVTRELQGQHPYLQREERKNGVTTIIKLTGAKWKDQWKPYLVIRIEAPYQRLPEVKHLVNEMSESMKHLGIEAKLNACLQGYRDGILNFSAQEQIVNRYLHRYNASVVEKMQDQSVLSVSAYSPHISGTIYTNDVKMNLQVATHVDYTSGMTKITVGTPIITTTY